MNIVNNLRNFNNSNKPPLMDSLKNTYSGRVVENYTKIARNAEPTRFKAVNLAARAMFAVLAVAPYAIATVGAILADATVMTAKGISNAYGALRNKFSKPADQGRLGKALDFVKTNKKAIIIGSSALASLGGGYYFRAEITDGASKLVTAGLEGFNKVRDSFNPKPKTQWERLSTQLSHIRSNLGV